LTPPPTTSRSTGWFELKPCSRPAPGLQHVDAATPGATASPGPPLPTGCFLTWSTTGSNRLCASKSLDSRP